MSYPEPVYTLRHAFESAAIVTCWTFDGLRDTVPRLEAGLYVISDDHRGEVGTAERHENGDWLIDLKSGVTAGPGYIIV